jgi:hypothetical protein
MEAPCAYRNMDAVAAHGSKKRGMLVGAIVKSGTCAPWALDDLPEELTVPLRFLADAEADMAALISLGETRTWGHGTTG